MGSSIECFMLDPVPKAEESLRRFVFSDDTKCEGRWGYHNASVVVGTTDYPLNEKERGTSSYRRVDPRWPAKCSQCEYQFKPDDQWQHNMTRLYKRRDNDNGQLWTLSESPIGSMWNAEWYSGLKGFNIAPDGILLMVKTPGGDWCVDGPSNNGGLWTRTGVVPKVTANPSIHILGKYHGWLRAGFLVEC